ncbi:MAG: signal peptidase I [Nocardioidaceae bacterium]
MTSDSGDDSVRRTSEADDEYADRPPATRPATPRVARRPGRRKAEVKKDPLPAWQEMVLLIGTALVLALIIKTFFLQAFYIPSGSMRDTLRVNDRILVEKWSYWAGDIKRGDIVVFDDPANWLGEEDAQTSTNAVTKTLSVIGLYPTGGHLVKRVVGVGGDDVACTDGAVEVNGTALKESEYVTLPAQACTGNWDVQVPKDRLWVLGDNRNHSADSRVHTGDPGGGFIPVDDVVGKVFVLVWPVGHWGFIHRPDTFDNPALDQAAGLISETAPVGLALVGIPPLYRRFKNRTHD